VRSMSSRLGVRHEIRRIEHRGVSPGRPEEAFTITELVVATTILVLAMIPVLDLFIGSARQARQTSDFGLAMALGEKVAEELRLATWENTHFTQRIVAEGEYAGVRSVVNAQSPFFGAIEDGVRPYGRIRSGEDPAITTSTGSLYSELASFAVGAAPRSRKLSSGGETVDVGLCVQWNDFKGSRMTSEIAVSLGVHGVPVVPPREVEDRDHADDAIRRALYPNYPGRTLSQTASETGADLILLRNLGDSVILVGGLLGAQSDVANALANLKTTLARSTSPGQKAKVHYQIARLHEKTGAAHLNAMVYLKDPILALASSFDPGRLGKSPPDPSRYRSAILFLDSLRYGFAKHLASARDSYCRAYNGEPGRSLAPRIRTRIFMKILSLRQLEVLTVGPSDLSSMKAMLADFLEWHEGRNPSFFLFAEHELSACRNLDSLRRSYPLPVRLLAFETFRSETGKVIQKVAHD